MNYRQQESPKLKIVREFIEKYPDRGNMTIAKIAYSHYPLAFKNVEDARLSARYIRGVKGKRGRVEAKQRYGKYFRNQPTGGDN